MPRTANGSVEALHPIAVAASRSGLTPDVLRVWERRYRAFQPARTAGGQRMYSDDDLRRIWLLAAATRAGRNIGSVARLPTDELARMVEHDEAAALRVPAAPDTDRIDLSRELEAVRALDAAALGAVLRHALARSGVPAFIERHVPALMRAVGDAWTDGTMTIAHEHLASAVVLPLVLESARLTPARADAPRLIAATPAGEPHAVGAALAGAAAAVDGWIVIYLGAEVPAADIAAAAAASGARMVAVSIVHMPDLTHTVGEVRALRAALPPDVPLVIGGAGAARLGAKVRGAGVTSCASLGDFHDVLARTARDSRR